MKYLKIRFILEFSILIVVFFVSLNYTLSDSLTYLVSQCSDCSGNCLKFSTVKSGVVSSNYDLNLFLGNNYSYGIFSGQFTSCELTNPVYFDELWYIETEIMPINSINYKKTLNFTEIVSENFTINTGCFQLECKMENLQGYFQGPGYLSIPTAENNTLRMFGQIIMQDTNLNANCYVNINDVLFTFLVASNTFTQSDVLKCTVYPSLISGFGSSLAYTLTVLSVIKAIHYFESLNKTKKENNSNKEVEIRNIIV